MATPFVQGRLRKKYVSVTVETECAHCGWSMAFEVDSRLKTGVHTYGAEPIVFYPQIDWDNFAGMDIRNDY